MIKKKDYELIAEAYARIGHINECWEKMTPAQKSKVEDVLKSKNGYKIGDHAWSENKKTVTLTHELGSDTERDIVVDDKGEQVVYTHSGPHNESIQSQSTFDPEELTRKFIDDARKDASNHKAHGSLAALKHLKGKKEGIVPENPHVKGSPAAQNWQNGFNEIMALDDKAGKKEVEDGKVHTAPVTGTPSDVKESVKSIEEKKKLACGKGCVCEECPECMPPKKKKSLEEAFAQVMEEAKKKHVFTKVEKAAEKIAGAQKAKMRKKGMVKEEFEEQMPDSRETAERTYGVDPNESSEYEEAKSKLERTASQIVHCLTRYEDSACDEAEIQKDSSSAEKVLIHVVVEGKGYTLTVEPARY